MRPVLLSIVLSLVIAAGGRPVAAATRIDPSLEARTPLIAGAWPADTGKFTFAILGDKTGGGEENWPIYDRAVDEINRLHPDLVITVGDHIQGYTADTVQIGAMWREYRRHAGRLDAPLFLLPGNHDVTTQVLFSWWERDIGRPWYSFDYRGCHFLVLNTEQERFSGRWDFGDEQLRFALDDLARSAGARQTFIFMHKPAWTDRGYARDWERIEAALGARKYTVFAGHTHHLAYDVRNGHRYIVLGPTGADLNPSAVKEFGAFHHWSWVTVDGDSAYISYVEPGGATWPQDIAPRQFAEAASRLVRVEAQVPEQGEPSTLRPRLRVVIANPLPDTAGVGVALGGLARAAGDSGWTLAAGRDTAFVVVAPGARREVAWSFSADRAMLPVVPTIRATAYYHGAVMYSRRQPAPAFPDSALRPVAEWHVIGPFPGTSSSGTGAIMARLTRLFGSDGNWRGGTKLAGVDRAAGQWRTARTGRDGRVDLSPVLGSEQHITGYAVAAIYSPRAQDVWGALTVDDAAAVVLNGTPVEGGREYGSSRGSDYPALSLRQGWNTLVLRIVNQGGGWSFRFRIADPERTLRFASDVPAR